MRSDPAEQGRSWLDVWLVHEVRYMLYIFLLACVFIVSLLMLPTPW